MKLLDKEKNGNNTHTGDLFSAVKHAEKYQSKNIISSFLVNNFMKTILETVQLTNSADIYEVGCGEGHILGMLAQNGFKVRGCDVSESSLEVARSESEKRGLNIPLQIKSVYDLNTKEDAADTVICCEVLEHLSDPELALKKLLSITNNNLILSVPREPIWHILNVARGKYWYALGNTPGHYQHWTKNMFINFVKQYAEIISVKTPLPWTLVHCRPIQPA